METRTSVADALGHLPPLSSTNGLLFDPEAFHGFGAYVGGAGRWLETGPFDDIPAPYFITFIVQPAVEPGLDPTVMDAAGGRPRDLSIWLATANDERMWQINAGSANQFSNLWPKPTLVGLLINGVDGEIWIDGVNTVKGINFGSSPLRSLRFMNHSSLDRPFTGLATAPMIYKGRPLEDDIRITSAAIMKAAGIEARPTSFRLLGRSQPLPTERLQAIAFKDREYYLCDSFSLYRLNRSGDDYSVVFSRDTRNDQPAGKRQINGLDFFGGYLWAGVNNFNTEPRKGWLSQYDPVTFSLVATHELDPHWNEGGAWKDVGEGPDYWAIYHDWPHASRFRWNGAGFAKIGDYLLPLSEGRTDEAGQRGLYQGAQWWGDVLITQTHLQNGTPMTHFHRWTGSGFDAVKESFPFTHNLGQGLFWENPGDVMLFASRTAGSGPQTIIRARYLGD